MFDRENIRRLSIYTDGEAKMVADETLASIAKSAEICCHQSFLLCGGGSHDTHRIVSDP